MCKLVEINVERPDNAYFVNTDDVQRVIDFHYDSLNALRIKDVNIALLEESLEGLPFVARAEVYSSVECELRLDVYQHQAKARVLTEEGSFYLNENGESMPLHENYTARVPILSGDFDDESLIQAFDLLMKLQKDELLEAQIIEIRKKSDGNFILYPRIGDHIVLWGKADDTAAKMKKLNAFYTKIIKKTGLDYYEKIDLRFENQVVATKK